MRVIRLVLIAKLYIAKPAAVPTAAVSQIELSRCQPFDFDLVAKLQDGARAEKTYACGDSLNDAGRVGRRGWGSTQPGEGETAEPRATAMCVRSPAQWPLIWRSRPISPPSKVAEPDREELVDQLIKINQLRPIHRDAPIV